VGRRRIAELAKTAAAELEEAITYLNGGRGDWAAYHVQNALELLWEILNAVEGAEGGDRA